MAFAPANAPPFRIGLVAPKNTAAEKRWLLGLLEDVDGEIWRPDGIYDLVWFLNATPDLAWVHAHTGARTFVVGMEPRGIWPLNYDPDLIRLADVYMGYSDYPARPATQRFVPFIFPVHTERVMRREFADSLRAERRRNFCLFATHDPNIRREIGSQIAAYDGLRAGPLFGERVPRKLPVQRQCRYEFITENEIGDVYVSEKIGESLLAGCVPIYWGGARAREILPSDVYVDLRAFAANGVPDIAAAIRYCLSAGVYERHYAAVCAHGLAALVPAFTIEGALTGPLLRYVTELRTAGFRNRRADTQWRLRRVRSRAAELRAICAARPGQRFTLRQHAGALVHDWPRWLRGLLPMRRGHAVAPWVLVRNRADNMTRIPPGVRCDWTGTRSLHLGDGFPAVGTLLLRRALCDWPVRFAARPADCGVARREQPSVSFVIPHRGLDRLPLLLQVLASIAAQVETCVECIVVEQDAEPLVRDRLPAWVRHVFDPLEETRPFNRARAFNRGVAEARGELLILHDGDTVVPQAYARENLRRMSGGADILNLKRFVFYLGPPRGADGYPDVALAQGRVPVVTILANATGGGSVAVRRSVYGTLGGMDEGFWGWGGEDVEWWDRCQTVPVLNAGYLPLIHLWHPPQPDKATDKDTPAMRRMETSLRLPAALRIEALRARASGGGP